jgi:putative addiction module component (TIGR02574 family)
MLLALGYNRRMVERTQELLEKALALPEKERAALAGTLIESLEPVTDAEAESAWQEEVARRIAQLDSGEARAVPWEEVKNQLAERLTHGKKQS